MGDLPTRVIGLGQRIGVGGHGGIDNLGLASRPLFCILAGDEAIEGAAEDLNAGERDHVIGIAGAIDHALESSSLLVII
jgi:hypothetical protein